jgi:two-component system OmpR family response regulator
MKILLTEDDAATAGFVAKALREQGHTVDVAGDGHTGLQLCAGEPYDLAIIDRRLPGLDGLSLVKALRAAKIPTPVLFLTTVAGVEDRVEGLEAGGDDYLVKPFVLSELIARVNALLRRPPLGSEPTMLRVADLEMDLLKRSVSRGGKPIDLLPREFRLLEYMMRNADRVVTRTMLLEKVWDFHFDPRTNVVETHVSRLRAKIDRPFEHALLHTVPRMGYSLHAPR